MRYFDDEREQQFTNRFADIFMDKITGEFHKKATPASVLEWTKKVLDYEIGRRIAAVRDEITTVKEDRVRDYVDSVSTCKEIMKLPTLSIKKNK